LNLFRLLSVCCVSQSQIALLIVPTAPIPEYLHILYLDRFEKHESLATKNLSFQFLMVSILIIELKEKLGAGPVKREWIWSAGNF
jgi:hypothetical protein